MTGEKWKKLFRQKGWLSSDRLRKPPGTDMTIRFRGDGSDLSEFSVDDIQLANEDTLRVSLAAYGFPETDDKRYYLWDDILYVRNYKSGQE